LRRGCDRSVPGCLQICAIHAVTYCICVCDANHVAGSAPTRPMSHCDGSLLLCMQALVRCAMCAAALYYDWPPRQRPEHTAAAHCSDGTCALHKTVCDSVHFSLALYSAIHIAGCGVLCVRQCCICTAHAICCGCAKSTHYGCSATATTAAARRLLTPSKLEQGNICMCATGRVLNLF
jgi:hypothetical protein